jgi:hypothetical protein
MFNQVIAIVDDDPELLNKYNERVKMSGYHSISSFTDPLLAYKQIQENPNKYSLVIIDDKKSNTNGYISALNS